MDLPLVRDSSCHSRDTVNELGPIDDIGIVEHAFLQGYNNELGVGEVSLDHPPNILSVAQIQGCINLQAFDMAATPFLA